MLIGTFSRALEGKPRQKKNITGNIRYQSVRETAKRICGYSSEVMVRISSYGKGGGNALANLRYISRTDAHAERERKEDLELETDRGEILNSAPAIKEYAQAWEHDFGKPNKRRRDTMRMILSMPEGTKPEAVKNATRDFAWQTFGGRHEYVFVLHTDEPHPHCHLTVKMLGHDGRRLDVGKEDLANWRERFAQILREHGVDAIATRRAARGQVRKAEKSLVQHIADSPRKGKRRVPKVVALREQDAVAVLIAEQQGKTVPPGPWEAKIRTEQNAVRSAWLTAAEQLEQGALKLLFRPQDYSQRVELGQHHAALSHARLAAPQAASATRPVATVKSLGVDRLPRPDFTEARVSVPSFSNVLVGFPPNLHHPVFVPVDHQKHIRRNQERGASYQMRIATPRVGEPPHQVSDLHALARVRPVPYHGGGLIWRKSRPLAVRNLTELSSLTQPSNDTGKAYPPQSPLPLILKQEIQHERPTYIQHRSALHQPDLAAPRTGPARTVPSLRELPGVDVVRHKSAQVFLQSDARHRLGWGAGADCGLRWAGLGPNGDRPRTIRESGTDGEGKPTQGISTSQVQGSSNGGRGRGYKSGIEGIHEGSNGIGKPALGSIPSLAGIVKLSDVGRTIAGDKVLAHDIRLFVAAMPAVETTRDFLKRQLASRFTRKEVEQKGEQQKGAEQAAPKGKELGL